MLFILIPLIFKLDFLGLSKPLIPDTEVPETTQARAWCLTTWLPDCIMQLLDGVVYTIS